MGRRRVNRAVTSFDYIITIPSRDAEDFVQITTEIFDMAIQLPNTYVTIDVESEDTVIGIAREDVETYPGIVEHILENVYEYEKMVSVRETHDKHAEDFDFDDFTDDTDDE